MTAASELLTVTEAMARLKIGRTKVYDLIRTRHLPSLKVGGCRRIPDYAVRDFIQSQMELEEAA
ncbi:helix-turn-helix domain-containing protein [Streptomyces sp. NPDC006012]|uniref:helix-turn-helix domain-containing protein n=1 Tax=Streptomyces sp. NPDC006012 TaxID=3364739 RepID=UPI0036BF8FF7